MAKYCFAYEVVDSQHERWAQMLRSGYAEKQRPICLCLARDERRSMYIAFIHGQHVLKRLPYSGSVHAPHCDHYEPPQELSGLGQVNGSAIRENPSTETTALMLDFALTKGKSRAAVDFSEAEHESVRSDGTKLTMRGLLHYLFDEAGLTRWVPAMQGKRSWFVVRRELLSAAAAKTTKGHGLTDVLYIPETFALNRASEIKQRQLAVLSRLSSSSARMILIGEVKVIEEARYGKCVVIKHMPDLKLMMNDDLHKRFVRHFEHQLQLWGQLDASHLLLIATVSRSAQGVHSLEAACALNVNDAWMPFETLAEWELLSRLIHDGRRFTKGLRYNLSSDKPLACAVLNDTGYEPTAMYLIAPGLEASYDSAIKALEDQTRMTSWRWQVGLQIMPPLPQIATAHGDEKRA